MALVLLTWMLVSVFSSGGQKSEVDKDVRHELAQRNSAGQEAQKTKSTSPKGDVKAAVDEPPSTIMVRPSDLGVAKAKVQFADKVVEITAIVKFVRQRSAIILEWDKEPEIVGNPVSCMFPERLEDVVAKVRPGQTITIRGKVDKSIPTYLWHCSFVNMDQIVETAPTKKPPNEVGAGDPRKKLLAEVEAKKREALPDLEDECKRHEAALEQLRKEEAVLRQNPRFGDPFNKELVARFNALLKKQRALAIDIQKARDVLDQKVLDFEQERRKIFVKFPASGDPKFVEHKGLIYTQAEFDQFKAYERDHADPRIVAESYMNSIAAKGLVNGQKIAGFFKNPKSADSFAVSFTVASANGRKVLGNTVHVFVFKDKQGFWQISAFSQDGVHVMLGTPPREFPQVADPSEKK